MEKVVTITKVQPLKERSYINGNGDNEIFVSRGFVMTDGIDTFYAEATGEYARQLPSEIDTTVCHSVQLQMNCRSYQDREGQTRYSVHQMLKNWRKHGMIAKSTDSAFLKL